MTGFASSQKAHFPFVVYGKSRTPVPHTWIDVDHREAAFRSAMFLLESGHKTIAAIEGPAQFAFVEERMTGMGQAFDHFGVQVDASYVVNDIFCDQVGYEHTLRLLTGSSPPTAFVYGSLLSAIGGSRAIRELNAEDRIAVVTHDNAVPYLSASSIFPQITVTSFSIHTAAKRVARHVIRMMEAIETELWEPQLISIG
jgi:LacI family transcriptional regulator